MEAPCNLFVIVASTANGDLLTSGFAGFNNLASRPAGVVLRTSAGSFVLACVTAPAPRALKHPPPSPAVRSPAGEPGVRCRGIAGPSSPDRLRGGDRRDSAGPFCAQSISLRPAPRAQPWPRLGSGSLSVPPASCPSV